MNNKEKLLTEIKSKARLLTEDEIVEFYIDNVQAYPLQWSNYCRTNSEWLTDSNGKERLVSDGGYQDYQYSEIKQLAKAFYFRTLGKLVYEDKLSIKIRKG